MHFDHELLVNNFSEKHLDLLRLCKKDAYVAKTVARFLALQVQISHIEAGEEPPAEDSLEELKLISLLLKDELKRQLRQHSVPSHDTLQKVSGSLA